MTVSSRMMYNVTVVKEKFMKYRRFEDTIIVRIDRGEEILEKMKEVALKENIRLASVEALGAVDDFTVGVYNVDEKKFYPNTFKGAYEIVSLTGSINTMNGEYYAHLHMSAADEKGVVYGGHLTVIEIQDVPVLPQQKGFLLGKIGRIHSGYFLFPDHRLVLGFRFFASLRMTFAQNDT